MNIHVFFQSFYLCFFVLISVGPVFLTTANISMTRGCKNGFFAALGCCLADVIFISLGAISAKAIVSAIPQSVLMFLTLFAGCFLLKIAYSFWQTDVNKLKAQKIKQKNFAISIKMFLLTFSSPLSIIGYGAIFSQIINTNTSSLSAIFGGIFASLSAHSLIVLTFGGIGKKINNKLLSILNKISALWIAGFACLLIVKFCKDLLKDYIN
ncbi:MAG: LysE family transporter [Rickettsiales bacterium]|nr:LysE family transporter [Rickettsiales bacterium]